MNSLCLTLPYPLSANRYWRSFVPRGHKRAIVTLSKEAIEYKAEVARIVAETRLESTIKTRVRVDVRLYPKRPQDWKKRVLKNPEFWDDSVLCIDLDNSHKVLFDALKGSVIDDDWQIWKIDSERMEPDGEARVVVTITPIETNATQSSLI